MRTRRLVAMALAAALVAGCADDAADDEEPDRDPTALAWNEGTDPDLVGVPMAVGGQEGHVDQILQSIAVEVLGAAGVDVTEVEATGNSRLVREDQLAGLIDLTWETTGTGWLDLLREIGPSLDPDQLYRDVRDEDLDENGIVWLPPAPADAGVGVVADPEVAEDVGILALSDLAAALDEQEEDVEVCVSSARRTLDPAGLAALADAAGVRIRPGVVTVVRDRRLFELTELGRCAFALVERLDPRLGDTDLELLEDDLGAFVAQQPAITVREDTDELAPGLADLFEPVAAALDTDTLRGLLSRVAEDGDTPDDVARDWLVDEGFADEP